MTTPSTPGLNVNLALSGQWSGAFDGTLSLTNSSSQTLSDWVVTFNSR